MVTKKNVIKASTRIMKQARAVPATVTTRARDIMKEVNTRMTTAERKVDDFIRENPKQAAAIAVGVGAAIGAVAATAMRTKKK